MPAIPALRKLRLEDWQFQTRLSHIVRLCLKKIIAKELHSEILNTDFRLSELVSIDFSRITFN